MKPIRCRKRPNLAPSCKIVSSSLVIYLKIDLLLLLLLKRKKNPEWLACLSENPPESGQSLHRTHNPTMICAFLSPARLFCWEKRSTYLSAADGEKPTAMTSMKPLHLCGLKPFFASKHLKIEVLRGAKPRTSATNTTGGFHPVKKPL